MDNFLTRLRSLAGLKETFDQDDIDLKAMDVRLEREQKISILIKRAFKRIGLDLTYADEAVSYDEEDERRAIVNTNESEVPLSLLMKLKDTGLSDNFVIRSGQYEVEIEFKVSKNLDNALTEI